MKSFFFYEACKYSLFLNVLLCLFVGIVSYLVGSIPVGYLVSKYFGINIKKVGSGNIGGTNVARALGLRYGILVIVLDGLKSLVPAIFFGFIFAICGQNYLTMVIAIFMAMVGHVFSMFLDFKGGKGVATFFMGSFLVNPYISVVFVTFFIFTLLLFRYVSLASIVGVLVSCLVSWMTIFLFWIEEYHIMPFGYINVVFFTLSSCLIIYTHRDNIKRIFNGTESSIDIDQYIGKLC